MGSDRRIVLLLKPLDEITNYLSKSRFPSISTVIPSFVGCIEDKVCSFFKSSFFDCPSGN
jgi:hypothetical protein